MKVSELLEWHMRTFEQSGVTCDRCGVKGQDVAVTLSCVGEPPETVVIRIARHFVGEYQARADVYPDPDVC